MNRLRHYITLASVLLIAVATMAQVETGGTVSRRSGKDRKSRKSENTSGPTITERMESFYDSRDPHDADLEWTRTIYRQIDLSKDINAPLYFPEDVVDGQQNLFRILLSLVVDEKIPAYEYLDGREVFTEKYQIKVPEMLDRFGIYYKQDGNGRGSKYVIEEADVPTGQVLNYYIVEKWEFDRRSNQMKVRVEAICPVLNKYGDYGGEAKYPMFWVKFDQLRPYLAQQYVFLTDDNNLARYSLDDYFTMNMYQGDIYKTKNLRNLSLVQQYPDPDDLKHAQDSIEQRLRAFDKNLWVPTREEYLAEREAREAAKLAAAAAGDSIEPASRDKEVVAPPAASEPEKKTSRTTRKRSKPKASKAPKVKESSSGNAGAAKSVRRRKR